MELGALNRWFNEWADTLDPVDKDRVYAAYAIADTAHTGQYRRQGAPYMIHPARVAYSLVNEFDQADPTLVCAALLHDVLEDCERFKPEDIAKACGADVLAIVEAVTYVAGKHDSPEEKARCKYEKAFRGGESAWWVKLADRIDNLRDTAALANTPKNERFKARYYHESCQYGMMASRLRNDKVFKALQEALSAIEVAA
jgi:(p)ppGpp synthase/HD superfamily hydrolase